MICFCCYLKRWENDRTFVFIKYIYLYHGKNEQLHRISYFYIFRAVDYVDGHVLYSMVIWLQLSSRSNVIPFQSHIKSNIVLKSWQSINHKSLWFSILFPFFISKNNTLNYWISEIIFLLKHKTTTIKICVCVFTCFLHSFTV